jgi:hypothetical protein
MRLACLCLLTTLLCTSVRAQEVPDFTLFRPGVQYLYENDFPIGLSAGTAGPVLGQRVTDDATYDGVTSTVYDRFPWEEPINYRLSDTLERSQTFSFAFIDRFRLQPGEAFFFEEDGDSYISHLGATESRCDQVGFELAQRGKYLPELECYERPSEQFGSGLYYRYAPGGYGNFGQSSRNLKTLFATALGEDVCGEFLDLVPPASSLPVEPFTLFRPGFRYLYAVDETASIAQRYYGMELPASDDPVATYETIRVPTGSNCFELVNSFAGATVFQGEFTLLQLANDTLRIEPRMPVGISWIANDNLVGRIDREVTEEVFGEQELVRYLVFSRPDGTLVGDEIRIGETFGLLTAPFFEDMDGGVILELVGVQNPDFGLQAIDYFDVTDFQVGNRYHVRERSGEDNEEGFLIFTHTERQAEIKEVVRADDGSVLVVRRSDLITYKTNNEGRFQDTTFRSAVIDSLVFRPEDMPFVGVQIGEVVLSGDTITNEAFIIDFQPNACLPALRVDGYGQGPDMACSFDWISGFVGNEDYYYAGFGGRHGLYSDEIGPAPSEVVYAERDTCGTGTPLDFTGILVGTNNLTDDARVKAYPNPTDEQFNLSIPNDLGALRVVLYAVDGRTVMQTGAQVGSRSLNLAALPAGVYVVELTGASGTVARRRLVVR